jgi:hypothetical protein
VANAEDNIAWVADSGHDETFGESVEGVTLEGMRDLELDDMSGLYLGEADDVQTSGLAKLCWQRTPRMCLRQMFYRIFWGLSRLLKA